MGATQQIREAAGTDLQAGEEGQEGVHPAAHAHGGVVHVHVEQQGGLADVLHDGAVMLQRRSEGEH